MANNQVATTGNPPVFQSGAGDDASMESAVRNCIHSAVRPARVQNLGALISHIPDYDLIDNTYGTKGGVPSSSSQLRGFPVPSITWNFFKRYNLDAPAARWQTLYCAPVMKHPVGFRLTVTLTIHETMDGSESGSTTTDLDVVWEPGECLPDITLTELQNYDGNEYEVNQVVPDDAGVFYEVLVSPIDPDWKIYPDVTTWYTTLQYIGASPTYSTFVIDTISGSNTCAGTPDEAGFYAYASGGSTVIADDVYLYNESTLATKVATGWYVTNQEGDNDFELFFVDSTGQVEQWEQCSE